MGYRLLRLLYLPVSLALLVMAVFLVRLPFFLEVPGDVVGLGDRVVVEAPDVANLQGDYLLTAVTLRRATLARFVPTLFDDDVSILLRDRIIPPDVDDDTYFQRQRDVFQEAAHVAAAVGLQAAGFDVDPDAVIGDGVLVVRVIPHAPADGVLEPGDVVVAVNGQDVATVEALTGLIGADDPAPRRITFLRDEAEQQVELSPADIQTATGRFRGIGVEIQTLNPRVDLPVPVDVEGGRIGGPSAGLVIALTVYDKTTPGEDLTAGRRVAGTGVITPEGQVRTVGGVWLKAVAAWRNGADVFLVPLEQVEQARAALRPDRDLEVIGVATFEEALGALREVGVQAGGPRALTVGRRPLRPAA